MFKLSQRTAVISVATLLFTSSPFSHGYELKKETDNIHTAPDESIDAPYGMNITEAASNFSTTLTLDTNSEQQDSGVSTFAIGDPGIVWNIATNTNYNNSFDSQTTNHYYQFEITEPTKITGRAWNLPSTSNLDIALLKQDEVTTVWNYIASSQMPSASEEQLSYIVQPGLYLFEVARISSLDVNPYSFNIVTTATYDTNEPDDNFWQARTQSSFETVSGTLDNNYDKDFIYFTNDSLQTINYSIIGGDYIATLYQANGTVAYTLPSNTLARLNVPAGSYYWAISSPSNSVNGNTTYSFGQQPDIAEITFTLQPENQGYTRRVNWGSGVYFALTEMADVWGTAYDVNGNPIADATLEFVIESSVTSDYNYSFYTTTDSNGNYQKTIASPPGLGEHIRYGAALIYHYDVHPMHINFVNLTTDTYSINKIVEIDDVSQVDTYGGTVMLNDVAYYTAKP